MSTSQLYVGYVFFCNRYNLDTHKQLIDDVKTIMNDIGYLGQIQNDFMDMYTDSDVTKKTGNDAENGGFCWLSTMAMELGTQQQEDIMTKFYGKKGKNYNSNSYSITSW